jgi:penicillin V acylase-like amidase (Ntn superfamily)
MKKINIVFVFLFSLIFVNPHLFACSCIYLRTSNQMVFGRNHDYYNPNSVIIFNPKNLLKNGIPFPGEDIPGWKSKYASITVSLTGVGYANSGMNEKGLAIGHMGLVESVYPAKDDRQVISETQWIQYMLDNCANTNEVIEAAKKIRIIRTTSCGNHYFICDSKGDAAIIEFLKGRMVVHTNMDMPYMVLCNDTYEKSMNDIKKFKGLGGNQPVLDRVACIDENAVPNVMAIGCTRIDKFYENESNDIIRDAFSIHSAMSAPDDTSQYAARTQYTTVFDITNLKMYFRTRENQTVREIDFKKFEDDCSVKAKLLDIRTTGTGNVNGLFLDYSVQENRKAIDRALSMEQNRPSEGMMALIQLYPDSFECDK